MIEILHSLKFLEFMNELGKTFSVVDNGIKPLGILLAPQNITP